MTDVDKRLAECKRHDDGLKARRAQFDKRERERAAAELAAATERPPPSDTEPG